MFSGPINLSILLKRQFKFHHCSKYSSLTSEVIFEIQDSKEDMNEQNLWLGNGKLNSKINVFMKTTEVFTVQWSQDLN